MKKLIGLLVAILALLSVFSGCTGKEASGVVLPALDRGVIKVDGALEDWANVPSKITLPTVDAGIGKPVKVSLENKWKLNSFKIAWDGENIYFSYDVMDKMILWDPQSWWNGDGFEMFFSGNLDYKKDMASLKDNEMETGFDTCLQYYMAGPESYGLYPGRSAGSAVAQAGQVVTRTVEKQEGYTGEGMIPLSIVPALKELLLQGKPIKFSVRFRSFDGDGITFSTSNVALPVEKNKLRPVAMQEVSFEVPGDLRNQKASAGKTAAGNDGPCERVTNFRVIPWDGAVSLSWDNPAENFKGTVVVRKAGGYPETADDGEKIYNGPGETVLDEKVKNDGTAYYYSAFSYNPAKKYAGAAQGMAVPSKAPEPPDKKYSTMNEFMGTNAFIDDPIDKISVVGFLREYHAWAWDEGAGESDYVGYPNSRNAWSPSHAGVNWDFDAYYKKLKEAGVTVSVCMQQTVPWLNKGSSNKANKPITGDEDSTDAASYIEHGEHMFQLAARYAGKTVDDSLLKLSPEQPRKSGLGLVEYFENWNEPDADWNGETSQFAPEELAAMCSADYDGHMGTLGNTVGIKNADPGAKLVLAGLISPKPSYIKKMMDWVSENRSDGKFPADVLNIHYYASDDVHGIPPEEDHFQEKLERMNAFRELNLPDREMWITEMGYDTNPVTAVGAPTKLAQAQWILRSYLMAAASGFDRCAQYMLRDVTPGSSTMFDTSGLVSEKGKWEPKPSFYFVSAMRQSLKNMFYDADVVSGNENVMISRFRDRDSYKGAYALWCPTSDGTEVQNYPLKLMKGATKARLVVPEDGSMTGALSELEVKNGKVTVNVSETPVFVLFE